VGDREIAAAVVRGDCARAADALIELALARGGRDNISAVVVRAEDRQGERTLLNPAL
jgi:protein phosphatase